MASMDELKKQAGYRAVDDFVKRCAWPGRLLVEERWAYVAPSQGPAP